jgi:hypothetical protein
MPAMILNDALEQQQCTTQVECRDSRPDQPHADPTKLVVTLVPEPVNGYSIDSGGSIQGGIITESLRFDQV